MARRFIRASSKASALIVLVLAGCGSSGLRDFAYGPPDAIARVAAAAADCGVRSPHVEKVSRTAIFRIDVATPEPARACLRDWVIAHERAVRFPPKI